MDQLLDEFRRRQGKIRNFDPEVGWSLLISTALLLGCFGVMTFLTMAYHLALVELPQKADDGWPGNLCITQVHG